MNDQDLRDVLWAIEAALSKRLAKLEALAGAMPATLRDAEYRRARALRDAGDKVAEALNLGDHAARRS